MKLRNRLVSLLLVWAMFIPMLPISGVFDVNAAEVKASEIVTDSVITVESTYAMPGETVSVDITIAKNPGILGMTLKLTYDESVATLTKVENGEALYAMTFTPPKDLKSGCNLPWDAEDVALEDIKDGVIATLTFKISENAVPNDLMNISLSYINGAIIDKDMNPLKITTVSGCVSILNYKPGDLNDNGIVDTTDVVLLRRYIAGGYGVTVNEAAADVNDDGVLNTTDVVYIRRFIAGGYNIKLEPSTPKCSHNMSATAAKAATCVSEGNVAYWQCTLCGKYFEDAQGIEVITIENTVLPVDKNNHADIVIIPAKAPTETEWGNEQGSECKACDTIVVYPTEIQPLGESKYHIEYDLDNNLTGQDEYIKNWLLNNQLSNPNPSTASKDKQLNLVRFGVDGYPEIPGYTFVGWYDSVGNPISSIPAGTEGTVYIQAKWQPLEYSITLYKNKNKLENEKTVKTYTVDKGYTLNPIEWNHYLFVAWTDLKGNVVYEIKPGTTGDIELVANWTSERNQTIPEQNINKPLLVYEDTENGQYFFTYKVGTIINVPLYTIKDFGNTMGSGISVKYSDSTTGVITKQQADSISNMISNATTESGSWTLSEEWNEKTSISENHTNEVSKEIVSSASENRNTTGSWNISSYNEGKTESVLGTETSAKVEASLKGSAGVGPYKVEAGVSSELGSTVTTNDSSMRYWNTNDSYSSSYNNSSSSSFTNALKEAIINEIGSSQEKGHNVLNSSSTEVGKSSKEERAYVSELTISTGTTTASAIEFTSNANTPRGWYRYVAAGTVHVYAVVGYDVATSTYYIYTYNVLDDEVKGFLDYSTVEGYDDYQNGVLPFEIPMYVNNYLDERLAESAGLKINADGKVYDYDGSSASKTVVIPDYHVIDNLDGTYSAVKVTGFLSNVFKENTDIETVVLGKYITSISDSAFEGCKNLKNVVEQNVTSIGKNAFKGCTLLQKYVISEKITYVGENAFSGVNEIEGRASTKAVAEALAISGANNILLDISPILKNNDEESQSNISLKVGNINSIEVRGFRKEYIGFNIESNAETTILNGITVPQCTQTVPLRINSENLVLTNVNVTSYSTAMLLTSEKTVIQLNGKTQLQSTNEKTIISKSVDLTAESYGELYVVGNIFVFGKLTNKQLMTCGEIDDTLTKTEFENLCEAALVNSYTISWNTGVGYSITVTRTESPNAGAALGILNIGSKIYYGDKLKITYTADKGYSLSSQGSTSILVTGEVNSASVYASATLNSYTYDVVYVSSNGTPLGKETATAQYGTTKTLSAKTVPGYVTPANQSIVWNETSKTITFVYSPAAVSTYQKSGTVGKAPDINYSVKVEYRNRTATSVEIRVVWTSTIIAYNYTVYGQKFNATCNSVSTGAIQVAAFNAWKTATSSNRSSTGTSSWLTIPLSTTDATELDLTVYYYQTNSNNTDMTKHYGASGVNTTLKAYIPAY